MKLIASMFMFVAAASAAPITITQGGWYVGSYSSDDPNVPAVTVLTQEPVYIYHSTITSPGIGILAGAMANVGVYFCYGIAPAQGTGQFFCGSNIAHLQVSNCYISGWKYGVYVNNPVGSPYTGASISVFYNQVHNCTYFTQLVHVIGVAGEVAWNEDVTDVPCSDQINMYGTSGSTPYIIHDNFIVGPTGTSTQAAILTDGYPGLYISKNIQINNNIIIGASFNAIALAYSQNSSASGNTVLSSSATWYGMQAYECDATNVISNNFVGFGHNNLDYLSQSWGTYINNQSFPGSVTMSDECDLWAAWQLKVIQANVTIGPNY